MFFAAGTAWGIESLRSFEATIALGEYLYHEEFRFEIEYCDRRKDEMGWEYVLDGMKQTQDSKNNEQAIAHVMCYHVKTPELV